MVTTAFRCCSRYPEHAYKTEACDWHLHAARTPTHDLEPLLTILEPLLTITLNQAVILRAIDKTKSSKSQGPDGIHPKLVKECKSTLVKPLELIYRKSLESGKLPSLWKHGNLTAIFKSGDKTKPENYRPISLTSVPGKLLERIIRDQVVEHMMVNNVFAKSQHGFISGKSCVTQLLEFLEDVSEALDEGDDVDVIYMYLDFRKAFDKVPHLRLLKKIMGIWHSGFSL